jgi:hypothetical protein
MCSCFIGNILQEHIADVMSQLNPAKITKHRFNSPEQHNTLSFLLFSQTTVCYETVCRLQAVSEQKSALENKFSYECE